MDDEDGGWISVRSVVVNELRRCGGAVGRAACREWRKEGLDGLDGLDGLTDGIKMIVLLKRGTTVLLPGVGDTVSFLQ